MLHIKISCHIENNLQCLTYQYNFISHMSAIIGHWLLPTIAHEACTKIKGLLDLPLILIISNAHNVWWSTLEPLIWPEVWVQMALYNKGILLKLQQTGVWGTEIWSVLLYSRHTFLSYNLCAYLLFTFRCSLIFIARQPLLNSSQLMVPGLTTRVWEHCWRILFKMKP